MLRHAVRRDSSGWVDRIGGGEVWGVREEIEMVELRKGSGSPGAECAVGTELDLVLRFVVLLAWFAEGVMRRDCEGC